MTHDSIVVTHKLCKWYGRVAGINDFSVSIGPGVTGLLGPNGAGKSTFIKLLAGMLRPSSGTLTLMGQPVWGNPRLLAELGYCPEHDGVHGELSALEWVTMLARLSGLGAAEARRRSGDALTRLGLAGAMERPLSGYSKGMRQRAKIAQALVHSPKLLLLDEPLTGCDPMNRVEITNIVKELGAEGRSVIVSSHILHEVEGMTQEIVLVYHGQVLAEGNIYQLRELIDDHPHQIRIECSDPRRLGRELLQSPAVRSLEVGAEGVLVVETPAPDECYTLIPRAARECGVSLRALTSPDNNLQAVFGYLTRDRGPEGVAAAGGQP